MDERATTRRTSIGGNIAVSAANVFAVVGASLVAVPVIIDHLGVAGYGIWTLGQSLVLYVSTAELGVGPAIARFVSVRARAHREVLPILWMAVALYALIGIVLVIAAHFAAAPLVELFNVPLRFHKDAIRMTQLMGFVALATLMAAASGQVLMGLEHYKSIAVTNATGSLVFLTSLLVLLSSQSTLTNVAVAALAQWTVVALLRALVVLPVLRSGRPRLPHRQAAREVFGFSARLQVAVLATLLNTQTDKLVVGLVASARTLGQVGIATQVAEAGRFLANAALIPMISRMAVTYGADGREMLDALYARLLRLWQLSIVGAVAIVAITMRPLIRSWLGPGHNLAATFAVLLVLAYGCNLLTGPATAYLRAIGRPGPEGVYGVVTVVANIVLTVTLGIAFGAPGVVGATLAAYVVSTIWFFGRVTPLLPSVPQAGHRQWTRAIAALVVAAAVALGIGNLSVSALPSGVAVLGVGAGTTLAFGIYLTSVIGVLPTRDRVTRILSSPSAADQS